MTTRLQFACDVKCESSDVDCQMRSVCARKFQELSHQGGEGCNLDYMCYHKVQILFRQVEITNIFIFKLLTLNGSIRQEFKTNQWWKRELRFIEYLV